MKKVVKRLNKALSVLLVAAMVVGMTPDAALTTYAAEDDRIETAAEAESAEEDAELAETETAKTTETQAEPETVENKESETTTVEATTEESADNTAGEEVVEESTFLNDEIVDNAAGTAITIPAGNVTTNGINFSYCEDVAGKTSGFNFVEYNYGDEITINDDTNSLYIALPKDTEKTKYTLILTGVSYGAVINATDVADKTVYETKQFSASPKIEITSAQIKAGVSVEDDSQDVITVATETVDITDGAVTLDITVRDANYYLYYQINNEDKLPLAESDGVYQITLPDYVVNSTTSVSIVLSAEAKQFAVIKGSASSENATVKNSSNGDIPALGDAEKATYKTDYVFKVAATGENKVTAVEVTVGGEAIAADKLAFTADDQEDAENKAGTYTITGDAITGAIVITATTAPTTPEEPPIETGYRVKESVEGAKIIYQNFSVSGGVVDYYTDIEFKVEVTEENKVVKNVSYRIGSGSEVGIVADQEGVYTIPESAIYDTVTIKVTLAAANQDENTVTFHITNAEVTTAEAEPAVILDTRKVAKGESLSFKVSPNEGYVLRYVSTINNEQGTLTANDGIYTVTPVCDMDIYVVATLKREYTLTLPPETNGFTVEAYVGETKKDGTYINIKEDEEVTLKVVAPATANNYKFSKLIINPWNPIVVTQSELIDNKYTLGKLTDSATVEMETILDESKEGVRKLTFVNASGSDAGSFTVSVEGDPEYNGEDPYLTESDSVTFTITPNKGYKLVSAVNGEVSYTVTDRSATGTVRFDAATKVQTITVTTEYAEAERGYVIISAWDDHLNYEITNDSLIEYDSSYVDDLGKCDRYLIRTGVKSLDFKVTTVRGYKPRVNLCDQAPPFAVEFLSPKVSKDDVYTYSIPAGKAIGRKITIAYGYQLREVAFRYNSFVDTENTVVKVNNVEIGSGGGYYEIGDTVTAKIYAKEFAKLTNVTVQEGDKTTVTKVDAASYTLSFKLTDDTKIIVEAEDASEVKKHLFAGNDEEITANTGGAYEVSCDTIYTGYAADERTGALSTVAAAAIKEEGSKAIVTVADNVAAVIPTKEDAGKTITLVLYKEAAKETVIAEFKLAVAKTETSIKVNGKADADIAQDIDTTVSYPIAITPATSKAMNLAAKVKTADTGIVVEIVNDRLVVTTPAKAVTDAEIIIYDAGKYPAENAVAIAGGTIKVSAEASKNLTGGTPAVKQTVATDKALYIQLTAPKNLPELTAGKYVYAVHVKPETATETAKEQTVYVDVQGASQDAVITVDTANAGTKGRAADYTVDVTVLQVKDRAVTIDSVNAESNKVAASGTSKAVKMSTRDPYYEDKLSVKKATGTVYTGQSEVKVGTVNFSKNASYLDVYPSVNFSYYGATVRFDKTDNGIYLSVPATYGDYDDYTPIGNYNITVTAASPENTYWASASFTVKVVRGITDLDVKSAATQVYKQSGKAASIKVTPVLNNGSAGSFKPQSNKVTYRLVTASSTTGSYTELGDSNITIKNGTVTIAKDYEVSLKKSENQFRVLAEAADFEGNPVKGISDIITITEDQLELGAIVITDEDGKALQGTTFKMDELNGKYVRVLNKGVQEKTRYKDSDYVDYENITLKSGNKAVTIYEGGYIIVSKPVKNFTFTAMANDGGKAKVTSDKYTVDYASATLGLQISELDGYVHYVGEAKDLTYMGAGNAGFDVRLARKESDGYWNTDIKRFFTLYNASISVTGAKIVEKQFNDLRLFIVPTAKVVTIKLTDKQTKKTTTYSLTNQGFLTENAPKVTTKDTLTAGSVTSAAIEAGQANRTLNFTVGGNTAYKYVNIMPYYTDINNYRYSSDFLNAAHMRENGSYNSNLVKVKNNSFAIDFTNDYLYKGSYKLQMTFGNEFDAQGALVPATKTAVVSVKVADPAKLSFKFTNKYKMSVKDTKEVCLTGKASASVLRVEYRNILNANVRGDKNHFRDLFTLDADTGTLSLQSDVLTNADKKGWLEDKDNLYGYVQYRYVSLQGYYYSRTEKITITMADTAQKFTAETVSVFKGTTTAQLSILANKESVAIASVEPSTGDTTIKASVSEYSNYDINLTGIPTQEGKYNITLKVVPASSLTGTSVEIPCTVEVTTKGNRLFFPDCYTKDRTFWQWGGRYEIHVPYSARGVEASTVTPAIADDKLKMTVENITDSQIVGTELVIKLENENFIAENAGKKIKIVINLEFKDKTISPEQVTVEATYPLEKATSIETVKMAVESQKISATNGSEAVNAVQDFIREIIESGDAGYIQATVSAKEGTSESENGVYVIVTLNDISVPEGRSIVFEKFVVISNVDNRSAQTVLDAIRAYLETYSATTNAITVEDIAASVKENVAYDTERYRLRMWEEYRQDATDADYGFISVEFEVKDIETFDVASTDSCSVFIGIDKLRALSSDFLMTELQEALSGKITNDEAAIKAAVDAWVADNKGNDDITYTWVKQKDSQNVEHDVLVTPATEDQAGSATFKLAFKNKNSAIDPDKVYTVIYTLTI